MVTTEFNRDDVDPTIAQQNDLFRKGYLCHQIPGQTLATRTVAVSPEFNAIIEQIRSFDNFDVSNDPYGEHDFGIVGTVYFKFDYFDNQDFEHASEDPSKLDGTYRVMTVAHISEL